MEVKRVLRMIEGIGESSYANNSTNQKSFAITLMHLVEKAVHELCSEPSNFMNGQTITIADLGCSSGPNTFWAVSEIINIFDSKLSQLTNHQYLAYLTDLESNDFNTLFKNFLPAFYEKFKNENNGEVGPGCYVAAMPGSFYGRLFPDKSIHFLYSGFSLHWLSQTPPELEDEIGNPLNRGNIFIGESSPPIVSEAYLKQFQRDFSYFLKVRSMEMVDGGKMVLIFQGRKTAIEGYCLFYLNKAVQMAISQGFIEESKVDTFNFPLYFPTMEELKDVIAEEGSFIINQLEGTDCTIDIGKEHNKKGEGDIDVVIKFMRAIIGPILTTYFGDDAVDIIFKNYREVAKNDWANDFYKFLNLGVSLTKKKNA